MLLAGWQYLNPAKLFSHYFSLIEITPMFEKVGIYSNIKPKLPDFRLQISGTLARGPTINFYSISEGTI